MFIFIQFLKKFFKFGNQFSSKQALLNTVAHIFIQLQMNMQTLHFMLKIQDLQQTAIIYLKFRMSH